jgi:hypothetical protein
LSIGIASFGIATAYQETQNFTKPEEDPASVAKHGTSTFDIGRGYVGLTTKSNYAEIGRRLKLDLVGNPDLASISSGNAAKILFEFLSYRARLGDFDPKALEGTNPDFSAARSAVNGDASHIVPRAKGQPRTTIGQRIQYISQRAEITIFNCERNIPQ